MTITKAFVLEDDDFKVIEQKSREMGDASASAALRVIIREYARLTLSNPPVAQAISPARLAQPYPQVFPVGG